MNATIIIGGSIEAFALAQVMPDSRVLLPEHERIPRDWGRAPTVGPITAQSLNGAGCVVEAAHPCDARLAFHVAGLCRQLGLPHLQMVRPGWRPMRGDRWHMLRRASDAAHVIPKGGRVLVATGRRRLPAFRNLDAILLVRHFGKAGVFPLKRGRFLQAEGPFTSGDEMRFLRKERIDWLLVHDAGGPGGRPKLDAARRLGLPVAMLARPDRPDGPKASDIKEAQAWVTSQNV